MIREITSRLLAVQFSDWSSNHTEIIKRGSRALVTDNPVEHFDELLSQVEGGEVEILFLLDEDEKPCGWSIYRVIEGREYKEFFSVASYSEHPSFSIAGHCLPILEAKARELGCQSISMHSLRPGLVKIALEDFGYHYGEVELRKRLT